MRIYSVLVYLLLSSLLLSISNDLYAQKNKKTIQPKTKHTAIQKKQVSKNKKITNRNKPTTYTSPKRSISSFQEEKKPIQVRGQSRNLSMGLVLKNKKEQINFTQPREHYDEEILDTKY